MGVWSIRGSTGSRLCTRHLHGQQLTRAVCAGGVAGMSKQQTWRLAETMARKALEQALTRPPDPPHQHEESLRLYLAILQVRAVPIMLYQLCCVNFQPIIMPAFSYSFASGFYFAFATDIISW